MVARQRVAPKPRSLLSKAERTIIEEFAKGNEIYETEAIRIHRENIERIGVRGNDHMRFMAEVDNPMPDRMLQATYRKVLREQWNKGIYIG